MGKIIGISGGCNGVGLHFWGRAEYYNISVGPIKLTLVSLSYFGVIKYTHVYWYVK